MVQNLPWRNDSNWDLCYWYNEQVRLQKHIHVFFGVVVGFTTVFGCDYIWGQFNWNACRSNTDNWKHKMSFLIFHRILLNLILCVIVFFLLFQHCSWSKDPHIFCCRFASQWCKCTRIVSQIMCLFICLQ